MAANVRKLAYFVHETAEKSANITAQIITKLNQGLPNEASNQKHGSCETGILIIIGLVCTQIF